MIGGIPKGIRTKDDMRPFSQFKDEYGHGYGLTETESKPELIINQEVKLPSYIQWYIKQQRVIGMQLNETGKLIEAYLENLS